MNWERKSVFPACTWLFCKTKQSWPHCRSLLVHGWSWSRHSFWKENAFCNLRLVGTLALVLFPSCFSFTSLLLFMSGLTLQQCWPSFLCCSLKESWKCPAQLKAITCFACTEKAHRLSHFADVIFLSFLIPGGTGNFQRNNQSPWAVWQFSPVNLYYGLVISCCF